MKLARTLVCSLVLLVMANTANASVMFFTDRTSFQNAITVGQTVDFESLFPPVSMSIAFGDATFVSTDGSGIHRTEAGEFGGASRRLAAQNSGGIRIQLAGGHFAIGLDVGELFGNAVGQFSLTSNNNALLDSRTTPAGSFGPSPSFVGWTSTDEIGSLEFFIVAGAPFETIDNVTLDATTASVVPAPATLTLLALGLLGVGFARRMRAG